MKREPKKKIYEPATEPQKNEKKNIEIRNEFVDDGIQSMSATPDSFVVC